MSGRITATIGFAVAMGTLIPSVQAQFHNPKSPSGAPSINQQAIQQARQQAATTQNSASQAGAAFSGGDMILPEGKREALKEWNPRISQMAGKDADIWGRAIHHSDETYTETKQDNLSKTLEQETKSKNGTRLQRRMIMMDQYDRPSEVMIYDGRDQFKYRGILLYDTLGRFVEEQLYDPKGTLIRRKVQEYTAQGLKLPVRSWDYVENIPEDLKLVITRENSAADGAAGGPVVEKYGLFGQLKETNGPGSAAASPPQDNAAQAPPATDEKRKGLGLGRLFGKGKE